MDRKALRFWYEASQLLYDDRRLQGRDIGVLVTLDIEQPGQCKWVLELGHEHSILLKKMRETFMCIVCLIGIRP